jgi:hypothetical protein
LLEVVHNNDHYLVLYDILTQEWTRDLGIPAPETFTRDLNGADLVHNLTGTDTLIAFYLDHLVLLNLATLERSYIARPELDLPDEATILGASDNANTLVVFYQLRDGERYEFVFFSNPTLRFVRKVVVDLHGELTDVDLLENGTLRLLMTCTAKLEPELVRFEAFEHATWAEVWHLKLDLNSDSDVDSDVDSDSAYVNRELRFVSASFKVFQPALSFFLVDGAVLDTDGSHTRVREINLERPEMRFGPWLAKDTIHLGD